MGIVICNIISVNQLRLSPGFVLLWSPFHSPTNLTSIYSLCFITIDPDVGDKGVFNYWPVALELIQQQKKTKMSTGDYLRPRLIKIIFSHPLPARLFKSHSEIVIITHMTQPQEHMACLLNSVSDVSKCVHYGNVGEKAGFMDKCSARRGGQNIWALFNKIKAGKFYCYEVSDDMKWVFLETFVGADKVKLIVTSSLQSAMSKC